MTDNYSLEDILKGNNIFDSNLIETKKVKFIADLKLSDEVEVEGKVISKKLQKTKNDKFFLLVTIADKTQSIRAVDWYYPEENNNKVQIGDIVKIKGKIVMFENRLQLNITNEANSVEKLNIMEVDPEKYLNNSKNDLESLKAALVEYMKKVEDKGIKALLKSIFVENKKISDLFSLSPAAMDIHHAYSGGLLEHSLNVTELSLKIYSLYEKDEDIYINKDIIIAGSLLHDIGKIEEYTITPVGIEKTEEGELIGHIPLGTKIVYQESKKISEHLKKADLEHIIHIILSHHGEIEYGSPILPKTLEALIVSYSDNIDSKIAHVKENIRSTLHVNGNSNWSEYDKKLERKIKFERNEFSE